MNSIKFLWAAYIATWVIHGVYLSSVARRYRRVRQRMKELGKRESQLAVSNWRLPSAYAAVCWDQDLIR